MLTAISTVLGFIPIAPTVFWGPMAFAIMGGLFVATILTLIVLPALYVIFFRLQEPPKTATAGATGPQTHSKATASDVSPMTIGVPTNGPKWLALARQLT
jgi:hypothetical protein